MSSRFSRRQVLAGGTGLAVLGGAGMAGGNHIAWRNQRFDNDPYLFKEPTPGPNQKTWKNWAGNQVAALDAIVSPTSNQELADIMSRTNGMIRPVGSGHSWSGLVPSNNMIVDISRLSGVHSVDLSTNTAIVGAGTRLAQAARLLAAQGLAFRNMPDINQQTLAGAFSTATHGTGSRLSALHDAVIGFTLVTADGQILDVTKESHPEIFAAGKVSLGALGIITQYTLQLVPNFLLHRRVWLEPIDQLLERAPELARDHPFFEFFYFHGVGHAAVMIHDYYDGEPTEREDTGENEILNDLKNLRDDFGWWPWLRRKLFKSTAPDGMLEDVKQESWLLLSTPRPVKVFETEYSVPVENGIRAFKDMVEFLDARDSFYFPSEFRYVGPDNAWLSPFNDGIRNSISFHTPVDEDYSLHKEVIEPMMLRYGGRPHWGKVHSLGFDQLNEMYPNYKDFINVRQELDPDGKLLNDHLKHLLGES